MLFVIVVLLAWMLVMRGQIRNMDPPATQRAVGSGGLSEPTDIPPILGEVYPNENELNTPEAAPQAPEKDVVALLQDYDKAAAALITSVGVGPVPEEHRMRLKRVLAGVSGKDDFLAEASALADGNADSEARPWLDEMRSAGAGEAMEDLANKTLIMSGVETPAPPQPSESGVPSSSGAAKTVTDIAMLKEVDTLIAFENYEQATELLNQMLDHAPANPEYRLRLLHILSAAGKTQASAEQEEILAAMMDGPLSETLSRVRRIGRDLLPGHPLFTNAEDASSPSAVAAFDTDPVFDVTFSEEAEQVSADFDPLENVPSTDLPSAPPELDDDLDDFMKSAFDTSPDDDASDSNTNDAEGGFDLSLDLDSDSGDSQDEDPLEGTLSSDIDNEFDVLLDELLLEDAERKAAGQSSPSLVPDDAPLGLDSSNDNLLNDLLELSSDDSADEPLRTVAYSEPADPSDEAQPAMDSAEEEDPGNTIFKMPSKLGAFPTDEEK